MSRSVHVLVAQSLTFVFSPFSSGAIALLTESPCVQARASPFEEEAQHNANRMSASNKCRHSRDGAQSTAQPERSVNRRTLSSECELLGSAMPLSEKPVILVFGIC